MAETISPTTEESIQQAEYEVPLSPAELLDLGRAKSILSQIDFMLTEALSGASKTPAWAAYIFADRATMSGRIGMLDSILAGVSNSGAKNAGKKFVKALYRVNEYRNILFHGMWAHQLNPKTKQGHPACIWQKKTPIRPTDSYDNAYNINTKAGDPSLQRLKKIAILMTDGDYNQEYASTGKMTYFGGSPANGSSSTQATELCKSMKAKGIEVYTVAFGDGLSSTAQDLLTNCATDPSHFYNAVTGDALKAAFRDIALKISSLRITQ